MALGKTTFSDIAAHQRDDLFADAICGDVPSEPTFRQRLGVIAAIPGVRDVVDDLNLDLLRRAKDFGTVRTPGGTYMPSQEDRALTGSIALALRHLGLYLHDHVIITSEAAFSMMHDCRLA